MGRSILRCGESASEEWPARCALGEWGAPRVRARLCRAPPVTSPAGLRARRCSRCSRPRRLRRVSGVRDSARRGSGRLRVAASFASLSRSPRCTCRHRPRVRPSPVAWALHSAIPPPWFSPGALIPGPAPIGLRPRLRPRAASGRRPLPSADHRPGGKPIPVRSLALSHWGNRTAAIVVYSAVAITPIPSSATRCRPCGNEGREHRFQRRSMSICSQKCLGCVFLD